jgi:MoxR-like ATPase
MSTWKLFHGNCGDNPPGLRDIPDRPPWREFLPPDQVNKTTDDEYWQRLHEIGNADERAIQRGRSFRIQTDKTGHSTLVDAVNAALHLRRPLMVTGVPGSGKTSLAYAIAYELQLNPVLVWSVTGRSQLQDALYQYDAIARLQDTQLDQFQQQIDPDSPREAGNLGDYIQLGPVGTAFLPSRKPRVLLIDEIDKSDLNLPNDLLNLFEEGQFEIRELVRRKRRRGSRTQDDNRDNEEATVTVRTDDLDMEAPISNGRVQCCEFPLIIMTSNGERDFPPAFYRRCLRVEMPKPTPESLFPIVQSHFAQGDQAQWESAEERINQVIEDFVGSGNRSDRATDQLLNAAYLIARKNSPSDSDMEKLKKLLFKSLTNPS